MVMDAKVEIIDDDKVQLRKFDGWLGGLWSVLMYAVESRRKVAELKARKAVVDAQAKAEQAEYERVKDIAVTKAAEIRKNCKAGVHEYGKWIRLDTKDWTETMFGKTVSKFYNVAGKCNHCGHIHTQRFYTYKYE